MIFPSGIGDGKKLNLSSKIYLCITADHSLVGAEL